jgi:curved DNA-binding protein CbpA
MRDFYSVLQVAPKAGEAEIKSAFRNLAKTCHPDMRPGDRAAEEAFQEIRRAYRFLSNPATRKIYDTFLADRRAVERAYFRRRLATMSATFTLTAIAVVVAVLWFSESGLLAGASERTSALELARAAAAEPSQAAPNAGSVPPEGRSMSGERR